MSVDAILYKVDKPTIREKNKLNGIHIDSLNAELNGDWEYKYFSQKELDEQPSRFAEIIKYTQKIEMVRTVTDYKQCFIDHGMPADIRGYSFSHGAYDIRLSFDDKTIFISKDVMSNYSHDETVTYYIYKYCPVNVDIPSWYAKTWVNVIEKEYDIDLSYHPHELTKQFATVISELIYKEYESGGLCLDEYLAEFMVYLLQALTKADKKLFIEFQD